MPAIVDAVPHARMLVAGSGHSSQLDHLPHEVADRVEVLGRVSETEKASLLASVDLNVAPHLGGESFGIVLLEAMAANTCVLASDLLSFRDVLDEGLCCGALFSAGDATALAKSAVSLLGDDERRQQLAAAGSDRAKEYDWTRVVRQVLAVYETVGSPDEKVREDDRQGPGLFAGRLRRTTEDQT